MRRLIALLSVLVGLITAATGLLAPASSAVSAAPHAPAETGCHRTLAHYPVLLPGDRGAAVRTLQCALNDAGRAPVVVDGFYGPQTRAAVRHIEAGFEGPAPRPGRINNGFWVLLFGRHLPDRDLRLGQHGPAVRTLQRALRAAGGDIVVDGSFGRQTQRLVRHYQRRMHVRATGVIRENTRFFLVMGAVLRHQN